MCTGKKKVEDEAKKKLEEEASNASIPHLILGMAAGVGGSWLGLGMFGGAIYLTSSFGDIRSCTKKTKDIWWSLFI